MKRMVFGLSLVLALASVADAQLFCRNGQCRLGARLNVSSSCYVAPSVSARAVECTPNSFAIASAAPVASCQPYAYRAASCSPVAYRSAYGTQSYCGEQRIGIFRRGLFPRLRAWRAARLNRRGYTVGQEMVTYQNAPVVNSTMYIEPQAATIEDPGPAPSFSTDDAPAPPVPTLSSLPSGDDRLATRSRPISLAVL